MAVGNEVSRSSKGPIGDFPLNPPWQNDEAMKSVLDMYDPVLKGGAGLIAMERQRQIKQEGWSAEHDDEHTEGDLIKAAYCYAEAALSVEMHGELPTLEGMELGIWPWEKEWWKPSPDPVRNLVFAGALIAAEIDRLQRKDRDESSM
jgi:hypothetical protein